MGTAQMRIFNPKKPEGQSLNSIKIKKVALQHNFQPTQTGKSDSNSQQP